MHELSLCRSLVRQAGLGGVAFAEHGARAHSSRLPPHRAALRVVEAALMHEAFPLGQRPYAPPRARGWR
ncbi:MAG: hypothetical protein U5L98_17340 [Halomonas sp.]|uniref:hypothetical protein n=1 Tax=Halomonas sp. TaxID=1486246 RepID=UPI002ACD38C7|nr:hypothetical protein [Halomonas sp.]MDZ7854340.1 hypothetical protein [Halomonas sp.]